MRVRTIGVAVACGMQGQGQVKVAVPQQAKYKNEVLRGAANP
jgi:hypothetical protein